MRLVMDLQACQSEVSAGRGVGRYAASLAAGIARQIGDDDLRLCFSDADASSLQRALDVFDRVLPRQSVSAYCHPDLAPRGSAGRQSSVAVAEALIRWHWMRLQPDILHVAHVFEGFHGSAVAPEQLPDAPGLLRVATVYDLIPLRFPGQYLADAAYKAWYKQRLDTLRHYDHLLAISDATRADVIEILGIAPDRITTIGGGVDTTFRGTPPTRDDADAVRARYGVHGRLVLYAGGDDYRKNLPGAVAGYAALPTSQRHDTQLVIVGAMSTSTQKSLVDGARRLGLRHDELVLPGFIADSDLLKLYALCEAFIFPSLYEGLGLPVLEAMSCGAPVIGANNSGIAEVIGRDDALFDARSPESLAERLAAVLGQTRFRDELRRHGVDRAGQFTWERTAKLALQALRAARERQRPRAVATTVQPLPRRRLALFTPLPPCRSGIADYNRAFLPYLSRHFDIDLFVDDYEVSDARLRVDFNVRPHREFAARRREYDGVVYDMGNSEFHAYMLEYIARYPGIVVLHDAYLSGLYGYVDFRLGSAGSYRRRMIDTHGPRARRYLAPVQRHPDPIGGTMVNLPASKSVIEAALGVISHTPFNLNIVRECYPEGVGTPWRIIKQMVHVPDVIDAARRRDLRAALGVADGDLLVCTFGHITWTKCGDVLLDAFGRSALAGDPAAKLAFVGELARDQFGHRLRQAIEASDLGQRVRITGYLDESRYADYLRAADLAVQLRTQTRGGASKAILDCLAHGVPLIANEAGSFTDYPDEVIHKIGAAPDAAELAVHLTALYQRWHELPQLGAVGRAYAIREHGGEAIAAQYAVVIDEFLQRARAASLPAALSQIGEILADADASLVKQAAVALHADLARPLFGRQRILVDVTHITDTDHQTGIQRVVRNIVRWLYCSDRAGFDVVAVRLEAEKLVEASAWLQEQGLLEREAIRAGGDPPVPLRWGDILLMLDSSWARIDAYLPVFDEVRRHCGRVYSVIYDLLPVRFPHLFVPGGAAWFSEWLNKAIRASDGLICISRAVADEVESYIRGQDLQLPKRVGFWHLGCDFPSTVDDTPTERVRRATSGRTLLMIGTIEPRKNHALALDAIERLWQRGVDVNLCIAGKRGWMVDEFMAKLAKHRELGRRLHFIDEPSDQELRHCYIASLALLLPSAGEGFGLPLIEAAQFGTPILASDIPVFHEVAGEHATYFPLGTPEELAASLEAWLAADARTTPRSHAMRRLTWEQSAEQLLDVVLENRWYKLPAEG